MIETRHTDKKKKIHHSVAFFRRISQIWCKESNDIPEILEIYNFDSTKSIPRQFKKNVSHPTFYNNQTWSYWQR